MAKSGPIPNMALKKPDGSYTEGDEERANLLLHTHFPGSISIDTQVAPTEPHNPRREDWETAKLVITEQKLKWAIDTFQPYKTAGIDGIFPALLKKGQEIAAHHLLNITRSSLAMGYIPTIWRRAKVIFIPKIGKTDWANPKSFRPISLTSFILKTMEKVVDNHIRVNHLQVKPLHDSQHAYRAGRSTETALYQLTELIQASLDSKETALCAFLDIAGAFDNIPHKVVKRSLETRGVNSTIIRWFWEMLSTRTAEAEIGTKTVVVKTTQGTPQGGVTSPLLWSLVVDELLEELTLAGIHCIGYADDIVIIAQGKHEGTLCDIIQRGFRIAERWCRTVGLSINSDKTAVVPFTRKRSLKNLKRIHLDGKEILPSQEVKYLGITLDSKLLWNRHIKNITSKATKALMICRRLAGNRWGCAPNILRWMYTMIVRPMITYGAVAWYTKLEQRTARQNLCKVQRLACICITGAMRTCPTAAMEVILDLTPLHIVVGSYANATMIRMVIDGNSTGRIFRSGAWNTLKKKIPLLQLPVDDIPRIYNFEKHLTVVLSNKKDWKKETLTQHIKDHTITWYTDASKTKAGTGIGVFGPKTEYSEPMGTYPSILQAEICAIERCVQFILDRNYRENRKLPSYPIVKQHLTRSTQ